MSIKVEFRKDRNRWQVTYYEQGKRKRPLFMTKREAENLARKKQLGLSIEHENSITIAEASRRYFDRVSQKKNEKSVFNDKRYFNLHEHFMYTERGIERIGYVDLEDLEGFRDWLLVQKEYDQKPMNMGPSSVNRCLRVLKHFYKRHVQWKNISETPCVYLEFLDVIENERRAMTLAEFLLAKEKAPDWFKPVMVFIYLTGAPPSCIERLTWEDIDFTKRTFSFLRKKGKAARWKRIPMAMTDEVFALLIGIRNRFVGIEGAVFRDKEARPLLADRISRTGNQAIHEAGIKNVTLYCLRHALASDMAEAGVNMEVVRQALGHESISTTQRYAKKVALKSIAGAISSVRGGSLVANGDFELRQDGTKKGVN